ncbi:hypothetical protein [Microlunatus sp. GCM10028923]|uniref:hypothetical protein n=1 Tax=Microlunatus sp. GCM10028923 TaxID=3273400 RepID=UPI00360A7FC7
MADGTARLVRRILIIVGVGLGGALVWAIIFGMSLLVDAEEPEDFVEQATFRTEKVVAVAGTATDDGYCSESKDANGVTQRHGTSYRVDVTWTGRDQQSHSGEMITCEPPAAGAPVTIWVTSRDTVYNRSPLAMYGSVPIAAAICAAGAWAWTRPSKKDRQAGRTSKGPSPRLRRLRRALAKRR